MTFVQVGAEKWDLMQMNGDHDGLSAYPADSNEIASLGRVKNSEFNSAPRRATQR